MARVARLFPVERGERLIGAGNFVALGLLAASLVSLAIWASAVANEPGKVDESAAATEETAGNDPDLSYANAVSDRFGADIKKRKLPFVTPEILAALQAELRDYSAPRATRPPAGADRAKVLQALDEFVRQRFDRHSYTWFRDRFDALKWSLWAAGDRPELTADELRLRNAQREWMREYVRGLPPNQHLPIAPAEQREAALEELERDVFGNPLHPFFHDPMSPAEFEKFKTGVAGWERAVPPNPPTMTTSGGPGVICIVCGNARIAGLEQLPAARIRR